MKNFAAFESFLNASLASGEPFLSGCHFKAKTL